MTAEKLRIAYACKNSTHPVRNSSAASVRRKRHTPLRWRRGEDALAAPLPLSASGKVEANQPACTALLRATTEQLRAQILELSALTKLSAESRRNGGELVTIKHLSSKLNYAAASYLTFQHNEYTGLPILDEKGIPKLRIRTSTP